MNKLNIFVCESFLPEFEKVVEEERYNDVIVKPFFCMCEDKSKKIDTLRLLEESVGTSENGTIICGNNCDILDLNFENAGFETRPMNYCFEYIASDGAIEYIVGKGGYVIGLGWLNEWEKHIGNQGFDRDTARKFYKDFCKELVLFDVGIDKSVEQKLQALSDFLELPYVIVPSELEKVRYLIRSIVFEWRLHNNKDENKETISKMQAQCAEYSALLDMIAKISEYTNKRDTIGKIKEMFTTVFGAKTFKYFSEDTEQSLLEEGNPDIECSVDKAYRLNKTENKFCIKIVRNNKNFGHIEVGDFLFPQYIRRYLNFAIEIAQVCGLVLSNIEQYEKIIESEQEFEFLSFHDDLTGLYNRSYLSNLMDLNRKNIGYAVFSFDIDKLKYVNDSFGHYEGDKLICSASDILKSSFRETDTLVRMGGDEFVAIVPECTEEIALIINGRIDEAITKHNSRLKEKHLYVSISKGFIVSNIINAEIEALIHSADKLMYIDKSEKKRRN